jgi:hypothetical protein
MVNDMAKLELIIPDSLYEQLQIALTLNKDTLDEIGEQIIATYVSNSFIQAAKTITSNSVSKAETDEDKNYAKANRKIPAWVQRPNQNNHKIIKAFLQIECENGVVFLDELNRRCSNKAVYPETFVNDFRGNFAQMKTDSSNSHGKVFVTNGDLVEIWSEVYDTVDRYRNDFLNSFEEDNMKKTITEEMVMSSYEIVKKVYQGKIGRSEGRTEIAQKTGMNVGSAGDFITNFLAMIDGQRYTRTLNTFATRYYLENIRNDYGEAVFMNAIHAVSEHVKYYNALGRGNLNSIQSVIDELVQN